MTVDAQGWVDWIDEPAASFDLYLRRGRLFDDARYGRHNLRAVVVDGRVAAVVVSPFNPTKGRWLIPLSAFMLLMASGAYLAAKGRLGRVDPLRCKREDRVGDHLSRRSARS